MSYIHDDIFSMCMYVCVCIYAVPSLEVTCPTSNASGTLKWRSPATDNPDMEIFHQNLTCACLQGNSVISVSFFSFFFFPGNFF